MASSGNGGIIGVANTVSAASCLSAQTTAVTATGTFTVQCAPKGATRTGSILVVAAGGSAGPCRPGGGGAGGFRMLGCQTFPTCGIPVTIGAGGANTDGTDTVFGNPSNPITSDGGGRAGFWTTAANPGGSGGGGGAAPAPYLPSPSPGGSGTACQGNDGGTGFGGFPGALCAGGGGGGAGAVGQNASCSNGGVGSPAVPVFGASPQPFYLPNLGCTGATVGGFFAGGGGGGGSFGSTTINPGGTGGGGNGKFYTGAPPSVGNNGRANSGGGGGGGYAADACTMNGGSGIVLVKECATSIPASAGGVWQMNTVYDYVKAGNWV